MGSQPSEREAMHEGDVSGRERLRRNPLGPRCAVVIAALVLPALAPVSLRAQQRIDLSGLWRTEEPGATVRIVRCGRAFCGTLASVGEGTVDVNNPDPALRNRRLVGLPLFGAGTPVGESYEGGLYNPRDGKTYSGRLTPVGADQLKVSGCVLGVLCRSQTWTRLR